jgi:hypothetical protein
MYPVTLASNNTDLKDEVVCSRNSTPCVNGMIFKAWRPIENLSAGDKAARAIVYFVSTRR